jgi:hypothetical protein
MEITTLSNDYWTATALHSTNQTIYAYDNCGVRCIVKMDDPDFWQPCEPWCQDCGFPKNQCDEYYTRCRGYICGEWFNEETGMWIETDTPTLEEERWDQHKFGLCTICKVGLDDRADFTFNYSNGSENGVMMCFDCDEKLNAL